jgi:hypothetical protein
VRTPASRFALLVLAASTLSCASGQARREPGANDPSIITQAEVLELRFANAFEAVRSLHPSWLQAKGADSFSSVGQVQVYLDENHLGGVETLATITPSSILWIRHYRALEATTRWGINHDKGAIVVATHP